MLLFDICNDHMHCSNIMLLFTIDSICNWSHWTNKVISIIELNQTFMVSLNINGKHKLNITCNLGQLKFGNVNFKYYHKLFHVEGQNSFQHHASVWWY